MEKMASLGQLTAGIVHEIKNPLNFVINFAKLSLELSKELHREIKNATTSSNQDRKDIIEGIVNKLEQNITRISEHGSRIEGIIRVMLLHARGKEGEFQWVDLNKLIAENANLVYHSLRALEQSFSVKIETHFDETITKVWMVPQDFSRAFLNIASNACYAANEKKKISPAEDFLPSVSIKTKKLENKVEVRVWDNGSGIPKTELNKIFTPFYTTKPAGTGTGLGLSIAHEILTKEHKGKIEVQSKEGEFTEFIITIPAKDIVTQTGVQ